MANASTHEFHQLETGLRSAIQDFEIKTGDHVEFMRPSLWNRTVEFTKRYPWQITLTSVGLGLLAVKMIRRR